VIGAVVIIVILLVFPVLVGLSGAAGAAVLGGIVERRVREQHKGSELVDLNR
jgi:hypothetical protein